jgi:hypothetical protein
MAIVFDEVVGSVEPRQEPAQRAAGEDTEGAAQAEQAGPDEAALAKWWKRRAWLAARRHAE